MIGNDIVDLKLAALESNWQRKGYLDKIFTNLEQQFILKSDNQNELIWMLWSRKEAVYKILIQQGIKKGFYPKKIECLDINSKNGKVFFDKNIYYTKTSLSINYIHSIAVLHQSNLIKIKQSAWSENCVKINSIPYLKINNKLQNISKSHHGRFEKVVRLNF